MFTNLEANQVDEHDANASNSLTDIQGTCTNSKRWGGTSMISSAFEGSYADQNVAENTGVRDGENYADENQSVQNHKHVESCPEPEDPAAGRSKGKRRWRPDPAGYAATSSASSTLPPVAPLRKSVAVYASELFRPQGRYLTSSTKRDVSAICESSTTLQTQNSGQTCNFFTMGAAFTVLECSAMRRTFPSSTGYTMS